VIQWWYEEYLALKREKVTGGWIVKSSIIAYAGVIRMIKPGG
jgi:hypothetical protein